MLDRHDASFASHLERAIIKILSGDNDVPGLYRSILSAQNWDAVLLAKGQIQAYEDVLNEMRNVARRMNGDQQTRNQTDRAMN
jgi:hypothetical protein